MSDSTESSCRFDLAINFKGKGEFPHAFMELFNEKPLSTTKLADMGANMLYKWIKLMFKRRIEAM